MAKKHAYTSAYGKWDSPEPNEVAFNNVKSGEWSLERFNDWVRQVEIEEYRNATATEDM